MRKKVIIVGSIVLIWVGIIGFTVLKSNNNNISDKSTLSIEKYTIPNDKKIILNGFITSSNSNFYVKATCSEKEHVDLEKNLDAEILVLPTNEKISGKITYISNNPQNQLAQGDNESSISNYSLNISLDNQTNMVNGYHTQISVKLSEKDIEIPKESIISENNKNYVYILKDKVLKKQLITVSKVDSQYAFIRSGLNEKDEIVTNPTNKMKEGQTVE